MSPTDDNLSKAVGPITGISSVLLPFPLSSIASGGIAAAAAPEGERLRTGMYSGGGHALGYLGGGLAGGALGYALGKALAHFNPDLEDYAPETYGAALGAILGSAGGSYLGARKGEELAR
jgi:hypothetical protein